MYYMCIFNNTLFYPLIKDNPHVTIEQLSIKRNVSDKTIKRDITKLKKKGVLKRDGGNKNGIWIVENRPKS